MRKVFVLTNKYASCAPSLHIYPSRQAGRRNRSIFAATSLLEIVPRLLPVPHTKFPFVTKSCSLRTSRGLAVRCSCGFLEARACPAGGQVFESPRGRHSSPVLSQSLDALSSLSHLCRHRNLAFPVQSVHRGFREERGREQLVGRVCLHGRASAGGPDAHRGREPRLDTCVKVFPFWRKFFPWAERSAKKGAIYAQLVLEGGLARFMQRWILV